MTTEATDVYLYWRKKQKGEETVEMMLPTNGMVGADGAPQPGLWKINVGGGFRDGVKQPKKFVPMQIWLQDAAGTVVHKWQDGLVLGGLIDNEPATAERIENRWLGCAVLTKKDKDFYLANGRWPEDPPEPVIAPVREQMDLETVETSTAFPLGSAPIAEAKPGHNSGDTSSFIAMREQIKGEIAEAQNYFTRNQIKTKADADKCENWRKRIHDLGKAADEKRDAEKRPHMDKANEIQALWMPLVNEAKSAALALKDTADRWVIAEQDRLRKIATEEARARLEAENKVRAEARRIAEAERAAIEAERAAMERDDPIAALTGSLPELPDVPPEPDPVPDVIIVDTPKIMVGTTGNRRSAKAAPATATIVDLKAAAVFYAGQSHPDMIALVQKLADKACKVNASIPGIHMSWQTKSEAAE